jgi:putative tryptophan/tyrosine transport system substrate-binding protein
MRRREFITLVGSTAIAWPLAVRAQQTERVRRIAVLLGLAEGDPEGKSRIQAFQHGLRDLGWIEGRNVQIDYRFAASNLDVIKKMAAEVIGSAPDVIVTHSTPIVVTLRQATTSIPIVFAGLNDPVGQGLISSLAHPGGNITGFTFIGFELVGKWISLLSDVKPDLSHVALMFNPDTSAFYDTYLQSFKALPQTSSVEVKAAHVRSIADIDLEVAELGRKPGGALIAAADIFIIVERQAILEAGAKHHVPVISPYRQFVSDGGLMSYGPDAADLFRRAGAYVDRIFKGARPGDLPVQAPTKYELILNLKTARALDLTIPEAFQLLANDVVE